MSGARDPKPATEWTRRANAEAAATLPLHDRRDFDDAARGFVATLDEPVIHRADGVPIIDISAHDFLDAEVPDTVHPGLWRHAQANHHHGLFEVTDGIYQVRGIDLANMTIVEGDEGIIVIDPLSFVETATVGIRLYRTHRGDRPIRAVIFTHSHVDHYNGARGVISEDELAAGVPVIAPEGFLAEAVSENVYDGNAMTRRAIYQYGTALRSGTQGQIDAGLANNLAHSGESTLIPPTDLITTTGETREIDGVRMVFQMAPGTEAPAEFLIHFPDRRALCAAEDATHTLHNLLTLRGAQVRDAVTWWKTLNDTVHLFGADTDVVFAQHGWPRWGTADVTAYLENQRDLYKYIHDQSLRLANHGLTMTEIAEELRLPASLDQQWYNRGFYSTVNHNSKAVYQRYIGWYDANPARLHALPPEKVGPKYVEFMGGADAVVEKARASYEQGEYRWVAEVVGHVVFAQPDHEEARLLQADAFEQLGYQCENPTWRNAYLMGAQELRHGVRDLGAIQLVTLDVLRSMTPDMVFDYMGIKLNGPAAAEAHGTMSWTITDGASDAEQYLLELRNGCLLYTPHREAASDVQASSDKLTLASLVFGTKTVDDALGDGTLQVTGDPGALRTLFGFLDDFRFWFPIVEP